MLQLYRPILKRALHTTLKHKWLWPLGFFAAFVGNGSVYEALLRSFTNISENRSVFYTLKEYSESGVLGLLSWERFQTLWQTDATAFSLNFFTLLFLLCLLAIFITFGVISQGAVIHGVINLDKKKKATWKDSFRHGVDKFWPILELNVITKVILFGLVLLMAFIVQVLRVETQSINLSIYIASFIIFLILGIIIYFVTIYGTAFIVLRHKNAFTALKAAWHLFRRHILLNLEMGLLLFIINICVMVGLLLVSLFAVAPILILYIVFFSLASKLGMFLTSFFIVVVFCLFVAAIGAWFSSFQLAAWAMLFEELVLNSGKSKIIRLIEGVRASLPKRRSR